MADQLLQRVPGLAEVYVWLCSQIGQPIDAPLMTGAQVVLRPGVGLHDVRPAVEVVIEEELAGIHGFTERLARGEMSVW
jgi:S-adenosylmethionine synthetase